MLSGVIDNSFDKSIFCGFETSRMTFSFARCILHSCFTQKLDANIKSILSHTPLLILTRRSVYTTQQDILSSTTFNVFPIERIWKFEWKSCDYRRLCKDVAKNIADGVIDQRDFPYVGLEFIDISGLLSAYIFKAQ